jgi:hypothetical protein
LVFVSDSGSSFGFQRAAIAAKSEKRILRERERDRDSFEISLRESFEFAQGREQGSFLGRN